MNKRSRLVWRCRRGTKEMDILLQTFLEKDYDDLSAEQQNLFELFLGEPDPDIHSWVTGATVPERQDYRFLIRHLQAIYMADKQQP